MDAYVILTPFYPSTEKVKFANRYRAGIERQKNKPVAVGLVTSEAVFEEFFADDPLYIHVGAQISVKRERQWPEARLTKIADAREQLRKWFIARNETYALMLDSDIEFLKPTAFEDMKHFIDTGKGLLVSNGIQYVYRKHFCYFLACSLAHRDVMEMSCFFSPFMPTDGGIDYLGEDVFFMDDLERYHEKILQHRPEFQSVITRQDATPVLHWGDSMFHGIIKEGDLP